MRSGQFLAALRRPLHRRIPFRRSTLIILVAFVALAGGLAYHRYITPPATSFLCTGSECRPVSHGGTKGTTSAKTTSRTSSPSTTIPLPGFAPKTSSQR